MKKVIGSTIFPLVAATMASSGASMDSEKIIREEELSHDFATKKLSGYVPVYGHSRPKGRTKNEAHFQNKVARNRKRNKAARRSRAINRK